MQNSGFLNEIQSMLFRESILCNRKPVGTLTMDSRLRGNDRVYMLRKNDFFKLSRKAGLAKGQCELILEPAK